MGACQVMKSLVVCVEFDDFLAITLPRNKKHFSRTLVVTSCSDLETQRLALDSECECFTTDVFYDHGAAFNKGAAVEKGLDVLGRTGWLCLWDADIVMPETIEFNKDESCLYTALRRTIDDPTKFSDDLDWNSAPITSMSNEYPGYFQLFHSESAGKKPWYETNWKHAGGYDSDFQHRFNVLRRPPFYVLHLGPSVDRVTEFHSRIGENWCGRVTNRLDGKSVDESRRNVTQALMNNRKSTASVYLERF